MLIKIKKIAKALARWTEQKRENIELPKFVTSEKESMNNLHIYPDPILKVKRNEDGENKLAFISIYFSHENERISQVLSKEFCSSKFYDL